MSDELVERIARAIADSDRCGGFAIDMARAVLSEIEAMGMVVVPREATADMCGEAGSVPDRPVAGYMARLWEAFISAAPKPDEE